MKKKMNLNHFPLDAPTAKGVIASLVIGAAGWTAHTLISTETNAQVLAAHSRQLDSLEQGQDRTRETLQDLGVAIAKVDGKLDVVNQKIDDDRRAARHHTGNP